MKTEEVFAAYHAARRAEVALFDAVSAAGQAGLTLDCQNSGEIVAIERAALAAMKDMAIAGCDAARREAIFAAVINAGDHSDIVGG